MPDPTPSPLLVEVQAQILSTAGPFSELTDEALAGLRQYLDVEFEHDGVMASREVHFDADDKLKSSFFQRLAQLGYRALLAADRRHEKMVERGETARNMVALELDDLLAAEPFVAVLSGTGWCTPDVPGD